MSSKLVQIGPTCGFFCMEYAHSKVTGKHINRKRITENIEDAVKAKDSEAGEIFDINTFKKLFERYYPDLAVGLKRIYSPEDIKDTDSLIILPVRFKELPHFIVVEHKRNGLRYYNPADGKKKYMSAYDLYGYHLDIKPYFEWKKYFSDYEKNRAAICVDNKVKEILYMPGTKIAKKIRLIKKDAEDRLLNKKMKKESSVRLKSYFLTVSRNS